MAAHRGRLRDRRVRPWVGGVRVVALIVPIATLAILALLSDFYRKLVTW